MTIRKNAFWNMDNFTPSAQTMRLIIPSQHGIASLIAILFTACSPATIVRRIPRAIVATLNRMQGAWPQAHVFQKRRERRAPTVAHGNAAPAIVRIRLACGDIAPFFDFLPRAIFGRRMALACGTMEGRASFCQQATDLAAQTSAAPCATLAPFTPLAQITARNSDIIAAETMTAPKRFFRRDTTRITAQYNQSSKRDISKVAWEWHSNPRVLEDERQVQKERKWVTVD